MNKLSLADIVGVAGLLAASYGFWLAWRPLGFIVGGVTLTLFALLFERGAVTARGRKL